MRNISNSNNAVKNNKKRYIIMLVSILLIITIILLIYFYLNKTEEEAVLDESDMLVTFEDTYEGINYVQEEEKIETKGYFYDNDRGIDGYKIDISYIKVDGLKSDTMQTSINNRLKEEAQLLYNTESYGDENILYEHVYNYTEVYIFNNVLSTMYCKEVCDIEGNITYEYKGVNIELVDFQDISFESIFISDTDLDSILSEEQKVQYLSENFTFSISPKNIYIPVDETVEQISLYENIDTVAIYKRYYSKTKLFDTTYNASPYVFTIKHFIQTDYYGLVEDNLFVDTCNVKLDLESYNENILDSENTLYKQVINTIRNTSYSNPSKRYLAQVIPSIDENDDETYTLTVEYNVYEISKEFFDDNIEEFVIASENKVENVEEDVVEYFNDPVMEADQYLNDTQTEVKTQIVDEKGKEIEKDCNVDTTIENNENTFQTHEDGPQS